MANSKPIEIDQFNGDLISRNAFLDGIQNRYCKPCKAEGKDYNEVRCRACWVGDMMSEVEDAPAVDAEPVRHGEWLIDRSPVEAEFKCSECGFGYIEADSYAKAEYNYCPNGAAGGQRISE